MARCPKCGIELQPKGKAWSAFIREAKTGWVHTDERCKAEQDARYKRCFLKG